MSKLILKNVVIAFPEVFEAKAFGDSDPKFSLTTLIEKGSENDKQIQKAIKSVLDTKFGAKAESIGKQIENNSQRNCYSDGDAKSDYAGFAGNMALRTSSPIRPTVVDRDRSPLQREDGKIYSGVKANVIVNFFAYDNKFGKGVSCGLAGVQFAEHGEPLGGATAASVDEFDDLSDGSDADDFV